MQITSITRTYKRSLNTSNYGAKESWITIESSYTAEVESSDDPMKISEMLYEQAKKEVVANVADVVAKVQASLNPPPPAGSATSTATGTPRTL